MPIKFMGDLQMRYRKKITLPNTVILCIFDAFHFRLTMTDFYLLIFCSEEGLFSRRVSASSRGLRRFTFSTDIRPHK